MFECVELHWTEYFKAVGPTLIAIFIAYVAYNQWQVNRASLREKLFERRFQVFAQTKKFLSEILGTAIVTQEGLYEFHETPQIARFLFDEELSNYLHEIRTRAIRMKVQARKQETARNENARMAAVDSEANELEWLSDQLPIIFEKFDLYLGFKNHK